MKIIVAVKTENSKWQIGFVIIGDVYGNTTQQEFNKVLEKKWPKFIEARILEVINEKPIDV